MKKANLKYEITQIQKSTLDNLLEAVLMQKKACEMAMAHLEGSEMILLDARKRTLCEVIHKLNLMREKL